MGDDEELHGIEDILPDDIGCGSESSQGREVGLRHPDTEGGVLLPEGLSGGNGRDLGHRCRCRSGIDEYILVVGALRGSRHKVADEFAEGELDEASEEREY